MTDGVMALLLGLCVAVWAYRKLVRATDHISILQDMRSAALVGAVTWAIPFAMLKIII